MRSSRRDFSLYLEAILQLDRHEVSRASVSLETSGFIDIF
jgi:hypothetical protein